MVETFAYFDIEVDVQRANDGGVWWFMTYYQDDEEERCPFYGIEKNGALSRSSLDVFNPSTNQARGYFRHHYAGQEAFGSQVAWATPKYRQYLKYYARVCVRDFLSSAIPRGSHRLEASALAALKKRVLTFGAKLKRLRRETGEPFEGGGDDSLCGIWPKRGQRPSHC